MNRRKNNHFVHNHGKNPRARKAINIYIDGTEDSVRKNVKKYAADIALKFINLESFSLLFEKETNGVKWFQSMFKDANHKVTMRPILVTGWYLHNLSYRIMKYSNDYSSGILDTEEDLARLLCSSVAVDQSEEHRYLEQFKNREDSNQAIMFYFNGIAGEQVLYQLFPKHLDSFTRELYILLSDDMRDERLDVNEIVLCETGVDAKTVIKYLQIAWVLSFMSSNVADIDLVKQVNEVVSEDYLTVISRYTTTYSEIRADVNNIGRQQLYLKPFVRTSKGETISVNVFLNMCLIDHCIFWIVRNHYLNMQSREFTKIFGELFEKYLRLTFSDYLNVNEYKRIVEEDKKQNCKRADWELKIDNHSFLIEQKSSTMYLSTKQQIPNIDEMKKYYEKVVLVAKEQLRQTELAFGHDYIKIILLYDDYIASSMISDYLKISEVNSGGPYWILTIDEMEMLLYYSYSDRKGFDELVDEKIRLGKDSANSGPGIEKLLNDRGIFDNRHLKKERFQQYRSIYKEPFERN